MDTSILEDIGLTNAEIKVYIALLELGTSTAGPVIQKTSLQNSVVHMTLHKLLQKGFVSYIIKSKTKYYDASPPETILTFIDEKKKKFEKLLPELKIREKHENPPMAEVYEGFNGFKNMLYEMIKNGKAGDEYLFFTYYSGDSEVLTFIHDFYREFEKERKKRGIIIKGISNIKIKDQYTGRDQKTLLFVDFPIPYSTTIFNDYVAFTPPPGEKYVSFLIRSKELSNFYRQFFYSIWDKYKN